MPAHFASNFGNYCAALEKRGFVELGSGYFSRVYGKAGFDRVIKVSKAMPDDGWLAYAVWVRSNPSRFAPSIHRIKWHGEGRGSEGRFFVAVLDRLDMTVREVSDIYGGCIDDVLYRKAPTQHKRLIFMAHIADCVTGSGRRYITPYDFQKWGYDENDPELVELIDYCQRIHEAFRGIYAFDCHRSNCMFTEAGRFVITDPLSFSRDETRASQMRAAA
jgi:hypothetical protein